MATSPTSAPAPSLIEILQQDHLRIDELFGRYPRMESDGDKLAVVEAIYLELLPHAKAEEEILYPAVGDAGHDEAFVEDLYVEQGEVQRTIESILQSEPAELTYDMKVKMLRNAVQEHVRDEETIMVQQMGDAGLDLAALGRRFEQRKAELRQEFERQLESFRTR